MNKQLKYGGIMLLWLFTSYASAQKQEFKYQRLLHQYTNTWHQINIPPSAYSKLNRDFSDVRILGITENKDTIEAPYILKVQADTYDNTLVNFKLINEVKNNAAYFYTFELPNKQTVNTIDLSFGKNNFDWNVTLEGSQNQQEWFTILRESRVVGIENKNTSYTYTTLDFKDVNYKYLRLKVPSSHNPRFKKAIIEEKKLVKGIYNSPKIHSYNVIEKDDKNKTEVLLSLTEMTPISYVNLLVSNSVDYYRPVTVEYAIDSFENTTGWHYRYIHLFNSTLSSLNKNGYHFANKVLKHVKITIDNGDNEPLTYANIKLHGNPYSLIVRFTQPATYYMVYGSKQASVPNYDITKFQDNIPIKNVVLKLGEEIEVVEQITPEKEPLFKDSIWLWGIMIFVIFILGWFSYKMLKN